MFQPDHIDLPERPQGWPIHHSVPLSTIQISVFRHGVKDAKFIHAFRIRDVKVIPRVGERIDYKGKRYWVSHIIHDFSKQDPITVSVREEQGNE